MSSSASLPFVPVPPSLFIAIEGRTVPLGNAQANLPLPQGPDRSTPLLFYGPYLRALAAFFSENGYRPLLDAYARSIAPLLLEDPREATLISEKHGALYHVARLRLLLPSGELSFAVNTAVSESQKAAMSRETAALKALAGTLPEDLLPRVLWEAETTYVAPGAPPRSLKFFVCQWFEGFHEFHLSSTQPNGPTRVRVWDGQPCQTCLSPTQTRGLYRAAARLLTLCFDWDTGRQVYPWHHAAGDFVIHVEQDTVDVRLITVRGYRRLVPDDAKIRNPLLDIIHFFVNLTVRMRLDRLDGTGELAWAEAPCVDASLTGFLDGCRLRHAQDPSLPDAPEVLEVLKSFEESDLIELYGAVVPDGLIEPDEELYLREHLPRHVSEVAEALSRAGR